CLLLWNMQRRSSRLLCNSAMAWGVKDTLPLINDAGFFAVWGISPPVALRLPGLRILGHLLAEGTSMPQSYRRQS
ncbi:hypothetical protein PUR39_22270, partial [Klebsiella pneumoniae]|nr:hypothetical protein [Klebsiella pneumoniae]